MTTSFFPKLQLNLEATRNFIGSTLSWKNSTIMRGYQVDIASSLQDLSDDCSNLYLTAGYVQIWALGASASKSLKAHGEVWVQLIASHGTGHSNSAMVLVVPWASIEDFTSISIVTVVMSRLATKKSWLCVLSNSSLNNNYSASTAAEHRRNAAKHMCALWNVLSHPKYVWQWEVQRVTCGDIVFRITGYLTVISLKSRDWGLMSRLD